MRDLALDNLANIADAARSAWELLLEPLARTSWTAGRGFWLHDILDDRFLVAYFLPLAPLLILLRRDRLRRGSPPWSIVELRAADLSDEDAVVHRIRQLC